MEKPFEVGEWVWDWKARQWVKILVLPHFSTTYMVEGPHGERYDRADNVLTRDPTIPPKPKKTVTKEYAALPIRDAIPANCGNLYGRFLPDGASNVRITCEVEE